MKVGLMVEGQVGLTWERWDHILELCEHLEFPTLFRSDHYFIGLPQQDSLDPFLSFVMAAQKSSTIRFGPLVTPITFRTPVQIGRMAAQIDQLSNNRFVLGIGPVGTRQNIMPMVLSFPLFGNGSSDFEKR